MYSRCQGSFVHLLLFCLSTTSIWAISATTAYLLLDHEINSRPTNKTIALNQATMFGPRAFKPKEIFIVNSSSLKTVSIESSQEGKSDPLRDAFLRELRLDLELGGILVLFLSIGGSIGLNYLVLKPAKKNFYQHLDSLNSVASHKLRNALMAISASTEIMANRLKLISPSEEAELVAIIDATDRLSRLVEDLLFLLRSETGSVNSGRVLVPIHEVLEDLVEHFESLTQNREIYFDTDLSANIHVSGDPNQLAQLFLNLFETVFERAKPQESVMLSLEKQGAVAIVNMSNISNRTSKIPLKSVLKGLRSIFEKKTHVISGLGLNLSIAQAIAQRHGGDIAVRHWTETKTSFQIQLPLAHGS